MQMTTDLAIQARDEALKEERASGELIVAASIGPYGVEEFIYPYVDYGQRIGLEKLTEYHRPRFEVLVDRTQPDILAVETIVCLTEVQAILNLLKTRPNAKAWISVICNSEDTLNSGESVQDFAKLIENEDVNGQVEAIGANCTQLNFISGIIRNIRAHSQRALVMYPNNGSIFDNAKKAFIAPENGDNAQAFANLAKEWREIGSPIIIGGCCTVGSQNIRSLHQTFLEAAVSDNTD